MSTPVPFEATGSCTAGVPLLATHRCGTVPKDIRYCLMAPKTGEDRDGCKVPASDGPEGSEIAAGLNKANRGAPLLVRMELAHPLPQRMLGANTYDASSGMPASTITPPWTCLTIAITSDILRVMYKSQHDCVGHRGSPSGTVPSVCKGTLYPRDACQDGGPH